MNRRRALITIGGVGTNGGIPLAGGVVSGSTDLEPTADGTVVRLAGGRIESISHPVTAVEPDGALLGVSVPDSSRVEQVEMERVWTVRRDGIRSEVVVELASPGDLSTTVDEGGAIAFFDARFSRRQLRRLQWF